MRLVKHRGKWAVKVPTGGKYSTGLPATREHRDAAERKARQILERLRGPALTVADLWANYMAGHGGRTIGAQRLDDAWKALAPTFGSLTPQDIDRALCRSYAARRAVSDGTVRKELGALKAALRWNDPQTPAVFELPPMPEPMRRHLTREEVARLIDAAKAPHIRLFIRLALVTGARKAALLSLTWRAVDFHRRVIRLGHVQGGKGRAHVPFTDQTVVWLREALEMSTSDYVIEYGGERVRDIRTGFAAACKRAGINDATPHVLRHTAAVWMAEAGRPIDEIAQYLGHTNPSITYRVYARFSPDHLRASARVLDL